MNLGSFIVDRTWRNILSTTQPGGDNWSKFKDKKGGGCLKNCPGWNNCNGCGPDGSICSEDWKKSDASKDNLNILFHIYNNFDHYNQGDLPNYKKDTTDIKGIRSFLFSEIQKIEGKLPSRPPEDDEVGIGKEDLQKLRIHKSAERNQKLAKKAKDIHGYVCQACQFDFTKVYGEIGNNFIEAHHLIPISTLKGKVVELDAKKDFGVLCSNCHRMIHRIPSVGDIKGFRNKYIIKR